MSVAVVLAVAVAAVVLLLVLAVAAVVSVLVLAVLGSRLRAAPAEGCTPEWL